MFFKKIAIFFTIFAATQAHASVTQDDSWSTLIKAKKEMKVTFRVPQFRLSSGFFYKATDVCLSGEDKKVIEPIKVKYRMKCIRRYGNVCKREIKVFPRMNVDGERFICKQRLVEGDNSSRCLAWGKTSYQTKTSFKIQVYQLEGTSVEIPLFVKELSLPACKDVD